MGEDGENGGDSALWTKILGVAVGVALVYGGIQVKDIYCNNRLIPKCGSVKSGYVSTSDLGVLLKDIENDGEPVPIMTYKGKAYVLQEGPDGRPVPKPYRIQIVEKEN
jgi:hypothetical protein